MERWFLKTLINVTVGEEAKIGTSADAPGEPTGDLVRIAFGVSQFNANAGLHCSAEMGETITSEQMVSIIPLLTKNNERMLSGIFYFHGYRFMLDLRDQGFTGPVRLIHQNGKSYNSHSQPVRHLAGIKVSVGGSKQNLSHVVEFKW